nr:hypothetical protein [Streptomyces sp. NRRL F-5635]
MAANSLDRAKQAVRTQVWDALTTADAVYDASVHGRIPHFKGAEQAAARLAALPAWRRASFVKAVPDKAQLPVRARALEEGKTVYMAVPKLATLKPFYLLDPAALTVSPFEAASPRTAAAIAPTVEVDDLRPLDPIILGRSPSTPTAHASARAPVIPTSSSPCSPKPAWSRRRPSSSPPSTHSR